MASILEDIVSELRSLAGVEQLLQPVNRKLVPDYYDVIEEPMDLQQLRASVRAHEYRTRELFLKHVKLILDNAIKYNGQTHPVRMALSSLLCPNHSI